MSKEQTSSPLLIPTILGLAVANTLASTSAWLSTSQRQRNETLGTTGALWGIALSSWGAGSAFKWVSIAQNRGYRSALAASSLLLGLLNALSPTEAPQSIFLVLRVLIGAIGAAPLYLVPQAFSSIYGELSGPNASILVLATVGGLATGPIIPMVAAPGTVFAISSIFIACGCMVSLPDTSVKLINPESKSSTANSASNTPPAAAPICVSPDMLVLQGICEGVLVAAFCFILTFLCAQADLGPLVVLLMGCTFYCSTLAELTTGSNKYTSVGLGSILLALFSHQFIIGQLFGDTISWPLVGACGVYGYGMASRFLPCLSLQVDICALLPPQQTACVSVARYTSCGVVMALVLALFEEDNIVGDMVYLLGPVWCIPPFVFVPLSTYLLAEDMGLTSSSSSSSSKGSPENSVRYQLNKLHSQVDSIRAEIDKLEIVLDEQKH